jgi:hypothetical protein
MHGQQNIRKNNIIPHLRLENLGVYGRIIVKWILKKCDGGGIDWDVLVHDRDRWRKLVNVVRRLRGPQNAAKLLTS